ncbi:Hint domain-containing protein [Donghicola sp. XS_ASV15]|uniref:Hint domain-containing protein n=1 Tax=Donghicola sp. XS_ASV15 TaxID=3241295 RepID=UPI0035135E55
MARVATWGWYVPSLFPGYSSSDQNNLDASGNGLSVNPAGYVEFDMVDANNDGIISDNDGFDGTSTAPGEYVDGPNLSLIPQEIALYTGSTVVLKGVSYTVDMEVTLFTDGTYGVRIMDYDLPAGHHKDVTAITLGTWNGVEYGGIVLSAVDQMFICFVQGTGLLTPNGSVPVEALSEGDEVVTADGGPAQVRWTAQTTTCGMGANAPILFRARSMGNERDVLVSPHHRVLVKGAEVEMLFGVPEVLVAAKDLVNGTTVQRVPRRAVTYVHFACDKHEIVSAEGMLTETLLPGTQAMAMMSAGDAARLVATFPALRRGWTAYGPAARMCLKSAEARLLRTLVADDVRLSA